MIHGLLIGNLATWYFTTARALAGRRRVYLYDLRGHGRSERVARGYDLATLASDLDGLLSQWECTGPVTLVGHSYGALIALRYAMEHDSKVDAVVAVEPPLPPSDFVQMAEFIGQGPGEMIEALPQSAQALVLGGGRRAQRFLEGVRYLAEDSSLLADLGAEGEFDRAALERVRCRTLVVFGDESPCRISGQRCLDALPNAQQVVLSGGHFLPTENPSELTGVIEEFVHA